MKLPGVHERFAFKWRALARAPEFRSVKRPKGFTLIELLIAVAIFGVLAAALGIYFARARQRAQNTAILSAARTIAVEQVVPYVSKHTQKERFGNPNRTKFLNGRIYQAIRKGSLDNTYNYRNPVSGNARIIARGGVRRRNPPAVYITNKNRFLYERIGKRKGLLEDIAGTIIIYMSNSRAEMQVYYVDAEGRLSEFLWTP